jgi:hypothetical protein
MQQRVGRRRGNRNTGTERIIPNWVRPPSSSHIEVLEARWENIYNAVKKHLPIPNFIDQFIEFMDQSIEKPLNYGYSGRHIALILLHYLTHHSKLRSCEFRKEWGMPKNGLTRIIPKLLRVIEQWNVDHIHFGTFEDRQDDARRAMPPEFNVSELQAMS